jgi:hypothetical protein
VLADVVDRRRQQARTAAPQGQELLLGRGGQAGRFLIGVGRADPDADHGVRLVQDLRRLEVPAIEEEGVQQRVGSEVSREGVRQAQRRRQLSAPG